MAITDELRRIVSVCVRSIFRDSSRELLSNEMRIVYSLPSTVKWEELVRVERALHEQPLCICIMSKNEVMQLVFTLPSYNEHPLYAPPKLLVRAIRATLRENLKELSDEQRTAMLSLTMRMQGLRATDGSVMTEGVSFKSNDDSVTMVCRLGANRLLDISRVTRLFASHKVDGMLTTSSKAESETRNGISAEGLVCSNAGLLPIVLYVQVAHNSLCAPAPITGKRAPVADAVEQVPRKRGILSMFFGS